MRKFFSQVLIVGLFVFSFLLFFEVFKSVNPEAEFSSVKIPGKVTPLNEPLVHISEVLDVPAEKVIIKDYEVLKWTNYYRVQNGVAPLERNAKLDSAAMFKTNDMFARQYFEHKSPSGKDGTDLITEAGYDYLLVGENLAEGNFSDAKDLVDAWMASPGHRANILKADFKEIGIAVLEGEYQGNKAWMSVQEFGRPASDCPLPADSDKEQIDGDRAEFNIMMDQKDALKTQMDILSNEKKYKEFNALVPIYNDLIAKINALSKKITAEVNDYNAGIQTYKACAGN
jgi:hypothetical protein